MNAPPSTSFISSLPSHQHDWLQAYRADALEYFIEHGFPKKSSEAWRYTSLNKLTLEELTPSDSSQDILPSLLQPVLKNAQHIVIYNGRYDKTLSANTLKAPIILASLKDIYNHESAQTLSSIRSLLEQKTLINQSSVTALNNAYTADGLVLFVPKACRLDTPIDIHYVQDERSAYTQLFIIMEPGSQAVVKEHFYGLKKSAYYQHHVSRIHLKHQAVLHHYRIQTMPQTCTHIYSQDTQLHQDSRYIHFSLNIGGSIARHEIATQLQGSHSSSTIHGINLGQQQQQHDNYLPTEHLHTGAYSEQELRQILKDDAKGVYYSKVTVAKNCPKTEAHQLCHSILLGKKAQAFARPELDILTDDVICSHGATTGAIDEQALYYLQSRGLSLEQATALLLESFVEALVEKIEHEDIRQFMHHSIKEWSQ